LTKKFEPIELLLLAVATHKLMRDRAWVRNALCVADNALPRFHSRLDGDFRFLHRAYSATKKN
jgi:hypothetical protein